MEKTQICKKICRSLQSYKIVKKYFDYLYLVDIDGKPKVCSISKMKKYNLNKFSKLSNDTKAASKQKAPIPAIQPRKGDSGTSDSDDSSDDSYFSKRLRRSSRLAKKYNNVSPTSNSELQQGSNGTCNANSSNTVQPVTPDTAAETTGTVTSGDVQSQPEPSAHQPIRVQEGEDRSANRFHDAQEPVISHSMSVNQYSR